MSEKQNTCCKAGDLSNPGIKPRSPSLQADSLPSKPPWNPIFYFHRSRVFKLSFEHTGGCPDLSVGNAAGCDLKSWLRGSWLCVAGAGAQCWPLTVSSSSFETWRNHETDCPGPHPAASPFLGIQKARFSCIHKAESLPPALKKLGDCALARMAF